MRIVAGEFRGRVIEAPTGQGTRPTVDRVREALFSSLYSLRGGFEDAVVLDAFAGSGALGLEALSRGASTATFVESDRRAADALRGNLRACGVSDPRGTVVQRDVYSWEPPVGAAPFDLVLLDPPYASDPDGVFRMLARLRASSALAAGAIVTYEHAQADRAAVAEAASVAGFEVTHAKKYGKVAVTVLASDDTLVPCVP